MTSTKEITSTSNPSFQHIQEILFSFLEHPNVPKAHIHMNHLYSKVMLNPSRIFSDPSTQDSVLEDVDLLKLIRSTLVNEMISPDTINPSEENSLHIPAIIEKAALHVQCGAFSRRLNRITLQAALLHAKNEKLTCVEVKICMHQIHFDLRDGRLYYTDWSYMSAYPVASASVQLQPSDGSCASGNSNQNP